MQFIDLAAQQARIKDKIDRNIQRVFSHGQYIMGPEVKELEEKLADYVGVKHAIACSSGTDALLLALMTYGVGPGKAIFTTPFTFVATAEIISLLGAIPVFVDIDPKTFNIDPDQLEIAIQAFKKRDSSIYPLPRIDLSSAVPAGVIAVDLFGLPADYDRLDEIANRYDLFVLEDAAQSFGAEYKGRKACSLASVACTSFFPAKPLGAYGDGGMCFTDDEQLSNIMRSLLNHGTGNNKYDNIRIGINGRLDTIQAAVLLAKLTIFDEEVNARNLVAARYTELLFDNFNGVTTQTIPDYNKSVWAQYSLLARDSEHRTRIQSKLKKERIPSAIYYPKPLHLQKAFAYLKYIKSDLPKNTECAEHIFSIPMHPYLTIDVQKRIVEIINQSS